MARFVASLLGLVLSVLVASAAVADDGAVTYIEVLKRGSDPSETVTGSGFLIDTLGHVLTARHVINDAGEENEVTIKVRFGSREAEPVLAQIVDCGDGNIDICLLRVTNIPGNPKPEPFKPVCRPLSSGQAGAETLTVMGFPPGEFNPLITREGKVSSNIGAQLKYTVSAALDPGMSGGPVIDADGYVVALNTGVSGGSAFVQPLSYGVDIVLKTGINCLQQISQVAGPVCGDMSETIEPGPIIDAIAADRDIPQKLIGEAGCRILKLSEDDISPGFEIPYRLNYFDNGMASVSFDATTIYARFKDYLEQNHIIVDMSTDFPTAENPDGPGFGPHGETTVELYRRHFGTKTLVSALVPLDSQ
jgi:hypothetical protein